MKNFNILLMCLVCAFIAAVFSQTLREIIFGDPSVMITCQANVPETFDKDIILQIENIKTDATTIVLNKSVNYTNSTMLFQNTPLQNTPLEMKAIIEGDYNAPLEMKAIIEGDYIIDLEDSYTLADGESVDFTVSKDPKKGDPSTDRFIFGVFWILICSIGFRLSIAAVHWWHNGG